LGADGGGSRWAARRIANVLSGKCARPVVSRGLRELGVRPHGVVRIDSACGGGGLDEGRAGQPGKIAQTFSEACDVAEESGERLAAEGEICWGGMHSWKKMVDLLEKVNRPRTLGFQADMAHTLLYILGYNAPEGRHSAPDWDCQTHIVERSD